MEAVLSCPILSPQWPTACRLCSAEWVAGALRHSGSGYGATSQPVGRAVLQSGKKWVASFDGFYLTRGHYSNNASATIHDHKTGDIAWFTHRTKKGPGHNWEGTGGAESMFDEVMGKVKDAGFNITLTRILQPMPSFAGTSQKVPSHIALIIAQRPCTKIWKR